MAKVKKSYVIGDTAKSHGGFFCTRLLCSTWPWAFWLGMYGTARASVFFSNISMNIVEFLGVQKSSNGVSFERFSGIQQNLDWFSVLFSTDPPKLM